MLCYISHVTPPLKMFLKRFKLKTFAKMLRNILQMFYFFLFCNILQMFLA